MSSDKPSDADKEYEVSFWGGFTLFDLVKFGVTCGLTYYATSKLVGLLNKALDPAQADGMSAISAKKVLAKRLKRPDVETMDFNSYELKIMADVIGTDEIDVTFSDIGGLEHELDEVIDNVVLPIKIYNNKHDYGDLLPPIPTGILLYGAPGTGKTLIAKAIAKEAGATFISIKASSILDKWFGESDRLVSALFSLGRKLSPSVIFIDEIETVLKKRDSMNMSQGAGSSMQGVFLSEWDGLNIDPKKAKAVEIAATTTTSTSTPNASAEETSLLQKSHGPVVVLGATNRPGDLDPAILRRMPVKVQTRMPDEHGRLEILKAHLKHEDWSLMNIDLMAIARQTIGYSGSDLRELVRMANVQRIKEVTQLARSQLLSKEKKTKEESASSKPVKRPLTDTDFELALVKAKATISNTQSFNKAVRQDDQDNFRSMFDQVLMR